jgi:hypothetical protein
MSPRLIDGYCRSGHGLYYRALQEDGRPYFCYGALSKWAELPIARYYWVEGSTHQWRNGSGQPVAAQLIGRSAWYYGDNGVIHPLWSTTNPYLRRLGIEPDGPPKRIYFRVWYQE